jgi:hypothetical protein
VLEHSCFVLTIHRAATITLSPGRAERELNPSNPKDIKIVPILSRLLSAVLLLLAAMGLVLIWQLERRPSGLVADVKGIAGIAAMANRSHILMDFKDMDTVRLNYPHPVFIEQLLIPLSPRRLQTRSTKILKPIATVCETHPSLQK